MGTMSMRYSDAEMTNKVTHIACTRSKGKIEFSAALGEEARRIANNDFKTGSVYRKCSTDGCQNAALERYGWRCEGCV